MSQGRSTPGGGGGGEGSQRAEPPVILADGNVESSANATMDEMLRVLQRQINEETARSAASAPSSPSRFCSSSPSSLARGVARRFLGKARSSSANSSPTRRSPATSSRGEQASSDLVGTSGSAFEAPARTGSVQESKPEQPARTGSVQETRSEQHEAAPTRSDFGAMMRSAVVRIQEDGREVQPVFNEMQQAMTGLLELTYGEAPNPPELLQEFATKWPRDDADPLSNVLMDDPVILASGHSVDRLLHQWYCSQTNICPITNKTLSHSFTSPNRLLRDMIAAWRLDHSLRSSSNNVETVSIPVAPSVEQIENILQKFSGHSALQADPLDSRVMRDPVISTSGHEISYPLYAEIIGQAEPSTKLRKEWDDIRIERKMRPLRISEKSAAQSHYKMMHNSRRNKQSMPNPLYVKILEDANNVERLGGFRIPENLVCPLCGQVMVDPVTIATGKTFDRECLRFWFHENGHICPATLQPVSSIVLRNERAREYLIEWRNAEAEG